MKAFSLYIDKKLNIFVLKNPITKNKKTKNKTNANFPAPPILIIFWQIFNGLVIELLGLIDAKGIDVAQPICPWGCPT